MNVRGSRSVVARRHGVSDVPLVLCHSFGTDHRMWEPLVAALSPSVDVVAFDVRNHGPDRRSSTDFSMQIAVDDLVHLLDELEIPRIFLAGISMGGYIAQEFAAQHPERLAAMALMATRGRGTATGEQRAIDGEQHGIASQVPVTLSRWFTADYIAENGPWVQHVRGLLLDWNTEAWARGWRAIGRADAIDRLGRLPVPVVCIAGDSDSSSPPDILRDLSGALPASELEIVTGPHLFPIENPESVARILEDHLRKAAV